MPQNQSCDIDGKLKKSPRPDYNYELTNSRVPNLSSMSDDIEPLEPTLWFSQIEKLVHRASKSGDAQVDTLLRRAMHLTTLAPRPLRDTVRPFTNEDSIEIMLDCKAFPSVAMALMPPPMTFTLKQMKTGAYVASVSSSISVCRGKGKASTAEKALLIGWGSFLLELREQALLLTRPPQRIWQSAQRQRSTEH